MMQKILKNYDNFIPLLHTEIFWTLRATEKSHVLVFGHI